MHPGVKKSATVVAAAAALALAANGVSVAATGHGLVGGHHNRTTATTVIRDSEPGPALRLMSQGSEQPSLRVSSSARVPHLNASKLNGVGAKALSSNAISYTMGAAPDDTFDQYSFYYLNIRPGLYDVSMDVMVQPASSSSVSPSFVACEVYSGADFTSFVGGTTVDVGLVTPEMSGSNVAQIPTGGAWLYCWVSSGPASYYQPATVSFVKLNSNRTGTPMAVAAKNAPRPESMVR